MVTGKVNVPPVSLILHPVTYFCALRPLQVLIQRILEYSDRRIQLDGTFGIIERASSWIFFFGCPWSAVIFLTSSYMITLKLSLIIRLARLPCHKLYEIDD